MKPNDDRPIQEPSVSALVLDADPNLAREPRLLADPRFLGILHFEMSQKVGEADAAGALLQLGFLRGLRDALRLVDSTLEGSPTQAFRPMAPLLAADLRMTTAHDGLEVAGRWPDRAEAEARLGTMGPSQQPACFASAGYTSGWLSGLQQLDILALETSCSTCGTAGCRFVAREARAWRGRCDRRACDLLRFLPFDELRAHVAREATAAPPSTVAESTVGPPVVHVWGPVMIVPFTGSDESLRAVELIGCDPEAREVTTVIVDFGGSTIDDAFGAVALERTLDAIEGWGAEAVVTGLCERTERVVHDLERPLLLVRKSLPEAIATAFQVVDAQRSPV